MKFEIKADYTISTDSTANPENDRHSDKIVSWVKSNRSLMFGIAAFIISMVGLICSITAHASVVMLLQNGVGEYLGFAALPLIISALTIAVATTFGVVSTACYPSSDKKVLSKIGFCFALLSFISCITAIIINIYTIAIC